MVVQQENLNIQTSALASLASNCRGDLRTGMNILQSAQLYKGTELITEEDIYAITGICSEPTIDSILNIIMGQDYNSA